MTSREFEDRVFGVVDNVRKLATDVWSNILHPHDESFLEVGIDEPKEFTVSLEEGGNSRFLPALAIAAAAVNSDPNVEPADAFEQFKTTLEERGRPLSRSDKPLSTSNTIDAIYDQEGTPEYLEGVYIDSRRNRNRDLARVERELTIPLSREKSVLLMPFDRKRVFKTPSDLPEEVIRTPIWGVVFGAYMPTDEMQIATRPMSTMYRVAFPVPLGEEGREEVRPLELPAIIISNTLSNEEVMRGHENMTHIVYNQRD
ncbi:MAG TPA: hypothetical protein VFX86_00475 [Candidatus Saccharimonadales bacterium]|nr:hypothetical protein [Candidatus Saccharimonadales bacterium]